MIALRNENVKICVIGPLKSEVAIYTARLASVWGTLQVFYLLTAVKFIVARTQMKNYNLRKCLIWLMSL